MKTVCSFLFPFLLAPVMDAQVVVRSVAKSGMAVPGRPGVTLDGIQDVNLGEYGDVVFTAGRRQNNTTIGNIAMLWDAGSPLLYLLGSNDVPPLLPVPTEDFLDSRGDPFDEPSTSEIVNIPGRGTGGITLEVRYKNFNVPGTKIGYVGFSGWGPLFLRETGTTSRGLIDETFEIVMTGSLFDPFSDQVGRARAIGGVFEPVFERGMSVSDLETGESLGLFGSVNVKWNSSGRFAVLADIENSMIGPADRGLFFEDRERDGIEVVARESERHPSYPDSGLSPEGIFHNVGGFGAVPFTVNDRGEIAFYATITDPDDGNESVGSLWHQEDGPEIQAFVRTGREVPIVGYGAATFTGLAYPMLTRNGDVIYRGDWKEGATFMNGLIRWQSSDGTHHMLLKKGDPVDATVAGVTISSVGGFDLKIEPDGRIVSKAYVLMPGGAGRDAIIAQRSSGVFQAVAIIGEDFELTDNSNLGSLISVKFPFNSSVNGMDGKPYGFSPFGTFALLVDTLSGGEHLIAVDVDARAPQPKPEEGVTAGRAEDWDKPTGFDEGLAEEEAFLREKLAIANDTGSEIDVKALTGLSTKSRGLLTRSGQFSRDDREFVVGYLNARRNVLSAIRLAALWDPKRAAWLLEAFRAGRILFSTQPQSGIRAFAEIDSDGSAEGGTEIIKLRFLSPTELSPFDPDLVQLVNSLLHESRHAFQAFPKLNRIHTAAEQAAWAKNRHRNELVASREEIVLVEDLIAGLFGNESGKLSEAVIRELNETLDGAEREAAKNKLLTRLRKIRRNAQYTELCRDGYCQALQRFLDAGSTSAAGETLLEELKRLKCFHRYRTTKNEFGEIGVFGGTVTYNPVSRRLESTPTIKQFNTGTGLESSFDVGGGAEYAYDAELSVDGQKLYVGAKTGATGTVFAYTYIDADDSYDSSTEEILVASADLDGGFYLSMDPSGKGLHAYALESGTVYRIDEAAKVLEAVGQLAPSPDPVLDFKVDGSFITLSPMPRSEIPAPGFFLRLAAYSPSGLGEETEFSEYGTVEISPGFGKAPVEGDLSVAAYGQPGAEVRLERSKGEQPYLPEANDTFDDLGKAVLSLSPALAIGENLRLVNPSNRSGSSTMPVWPEGDVRDSLRALAASDRGLYLEAEGTPGGQYSIQWGRSLENWNPPMPFRMSPFGTSIQIDPSITEAPPEYFGRLID